VRERDKATEALLNSCIPVGLEGGLLRLATNEFVLKKITNDAAARGMIESVVSEVLGAPCTLKLELAGKRSRTTRSADIPEDGLVATALDLGGEIVDE
jgi:hypothetical protein